MYLTLEILTLSLTEFDNFGDDDDDGDVVIKLMLVASN